MSLHLKYVYNSEYFSITYTIVLLRGSYLTGVKRNNLLYDTLTIALRFVYLSVDTSDSLSRSIYLNTGPTRPLEIDEQRGRREAVF